MTMETKKKTEIKKGAPMQVDGHMFKTQIDIPQDARTEMIRLLNQALADMSDLYSQTKQAHWNVKGPDFFQLHELFDELAEMVHPFQDEIAERVTALGGFAMGTARMAAGASALPEFPEITDGMLSVEALAERYADVAASCREGIDKAERAEDMVTSDLLIDVVRKLDKGLWFLEAHLQKE